MTTRTTGLFLVFLLGSTSAWAQASRAKPVNTYKVIRASAAVSALQALVKNGGQGKLEGMKDRVSGATKALQQRRRGESGWADLVIKGVLSVKQQSPKKAVKESKVWPSESLLHGERDVLQSAPRLWRIELPGTPSYVAFIHGKSGNVLLIGEVAP